MSSVVQRNGKPMTSAPTMMEDQPRLLHVFLCHASEDKAAARKLYSKLRKAGFKPWLDEEAILGGVRWEDAIEDGVRDSDAVVVCLSSVSIKKEGYLHTEIELVMKVASEKPDDVIFVIPVKLDACEIPRRMNKWQCVDLFQRGGYGRLVKALEARAKQLGVQVAAPVTPSRREVGNLARGRSQTEFEKANQAAKFILKKSGLRPKIGLILGSGLGDYADRLAHSTEIQYRDIPHFAVPTAIGHAGRLLIGEKGGIPIAAMLGRFHLYEGLRLDQVVFPVRVLVRMGVRAAILLSAAGSLNPKFPPGSLVVISDHISLLTANPLTGTNDESFGPRFPDMTEVYTERYRYLAHIAAEELAIPLLDGVYAGHAGPAYETPTEIRSMRAMGADLVGMSLVPEAIAARHAGLEVLAIAVVTNYGAGLSAGLLSHEEVLEQVQQLRGKTTALLDGVIPKITAALGS
jgi:purine-nucleoside phosphorylase